MKDFRVKRFFATTVSDSKLQRCYLHAEFHNTHCTLKCRFSYTY